MNKLIAFIQNNEGLMLKPYRCTSGKLTIGYGHNLDDRGIPTVVADMLFLLDLRETQLEVLRVFPNILSFSENRRNALTDMMFNLGPVRFLKFKLMIGAVRDDDWLKASEEAQDSRWFTQVGRRAQKVIKMLREG